MLEVVNLLCINLPQFALNGSPIYMQVIDLGLALDSQAKNQSSQSLYRKSRNTYLAIYFKLRCLNLPHAIFVSYLIVKLIFILLLFEIPPLLPHLHFLLSFSCHSPLSFLPFSPQSPTTFSLSLSWPQPSSSAFSSLLFSTWPLSSSLLSSFFSLLYTSAHLQRPMQPLPTPSLRRERKNTLYKSLFC